MNTAFGEMISVVLAETHNAQLTIHVTVSIDDDCCHWGTGWEVHKNTYSTCYTQDRSEMVWNEDFSTRGRVPQSSTMDFLFWARLGNSQVLVSAATLRCSHLANTAPFLTIASNIEKEYVDSVLASYVFENGILRK